MDYRGGTELAKLQWDAIHAPGLVIGVFESEGDGAILSFNDETQFRNLVDNKNRIISSFKPVDPKMMAVPVMDPNRDYVIGGVNLYRFDVNTQAPVLYKSINAADFETDKDIVVNILSASKDVLILNSIDRCLYTYQHIIFKDPVPSASIINSIETSVDRNNWKTGVLFGADNSCFADGVNAIIAKIGRASCRERVYLAV